MSDIRTQRQEDTIPPRLPDTTPPLYPSGDYSYILEVVMGMQKTMGQVEQAVKTLTEESKEVRKKLDRISHIVYAAGVIGTIAVGIFIFFANKIADVLIAGLKPHT